MSVLAEKLNQFYGKKFRHDGKEYAVVDVTVRDTKAVIRTDKRTFVFYESELALFIPSIEFITNGSVEIGVKTHDVTIVNPVNNSEKVNNKLMEMFDKIVNHPSKENIAQAETMVKLSDAMVKNELMRLKYLNNR